MFHERRVILVALVAGVFVASLLAMPAFTAPPGQGVQSLPGGDPITYYATRSDTLFRVPPRFPPGGVRPQTATFSINYMAAGAVWRSTYTCQTWPDAAKTAFNYAASVWGGLLSSPVPITINACWSNMGSSGILGSSGSNNFFKGFTGAPVLNTWYPVALANALSGSDLDGANADMDICYNSSRSDWYFGTDGSPLGSQYDFASVVLHEIAHGLGFAGSMSKSGSNASWGGGTAYPIAYDRFAENGAGQSLIDTGIFPNNSPQLLAQLTSNNIYFDGPHANAANGGSRPKLYAPSTWAQGSSYAHLDAATFDSTVNALMTWSLNNGEVAHDPGPVGMGVLEDVGWTASGGAPTATPTRTPTTTPTPTRTPTATPTPIAPDLSITKRAILARPFTPGDRVTYTLSVANVGNQTASSPRVTDTLSANLVGPSFASNFAGISAVTGPPNYVFTWPSLPAGAGGVITIYATISPGIPVTAAIVNSATVGCPNDSNAGNNTSLTLIGGRAVYLPIVVRNYVAPTPVATATPTVTPSPTAGAGWVNIITENFEGTFPGAWTVLDSNGATGGTYYWGKRNCSPLAGSYSGWAVGGGDGSSLSCGVSYPDNANSWMVTTNYFSLVGATAADVKASAYINTEQYFDYFKLLASVDGTNFYGWQWSGGYGATSVALDLAAVPTYGSMLGDASVWIAFVFQSDFSLGYPSGAIIDSIVLRKCTTGSCPVTLSPAEAPGTAVGPVTLNLP